MTQEEAKKNLVLAVEHAKSLEKILGKLFSYYYVKWEQFDSETTIDEDKEIELWETWKGFRQLRTDFDKIRRCLKGNENEIINKVKQYDND